MKTMYKMLCICIAGLLAAGALVLPAASAGIEEYAADYGVTIVSQKEYDKLNRKFRTIDISGQANMGFEDDVAGDGVGGWSDQGSINDMKYFDRFGTQTSYGVTMNIIDPNENNGKAVITLRGQKDLHFPNQVTVPVNDKAQSIYTVHAAAWSSGVVGTYRLVYEDGTDAEIPMVHQVNIGNWWGKDPVNLIRPFWVGKNDSTGNVIMHLTCFSNPYPDKTIREISLETTGDGAYMMVVAMALCDEGAYLPEVPKEEINPVFNPDQSNWFDYEMFDDSKLSGSAYDVSDYLHKPAGSKGRVYADGGRLYFENGEEAHFWGGNVVLIAPTSPKETIDRYMEFIKTCGVNYVRFHHMDNDGVANNIYGADHSTYDFDPVSMDNFCYFWAKCKEAGIYIGVEMIVSSLPRQGYGIRAMEDVLFGFKFEGIFDPVLRDIQKRYCHQMLTWKNPYTNTTLAEDPAVLYVEITNENNLSGYGSTNTNNFSMTTDFYKNQFQGLFNDWLIQKYGYDEALRQAWTDQEGKGLLEGESLADKSVAIPSDYKKQNYCAQRNYDILKFIGDTQLEYFRDMESYMRSLGYEGLVLGTAEVIEECLSDTYINAQMGILDRHRYYAHPSGGYEPGLSQIPAGGRDTLAKMLDKSIWKVYGSENVYNKPFLISEWQDCIGNQYNVEGQLLMSAFSQYKNWNTCMFNLIEGTWGTCVNNKQRMFDVIGQALRMQILPYASRMFLRGDVKESQKEYYKLYTDEQIFDPLNNIPQGEMGVFPYGKTGIMFEDVGLCDNDMDVLEKAQNKAQPMVSDTGEIVWDNDKGTISINTAKTQAFTGMPGGRSIYLEDVQFDLDNYFATMILQSVDDAPIDGAQKLMLFAGARVSNSGMKLKNDGSGWLSAGEAPQIIEPVEGEAVIKNHNAYRAYSIDSSGQRREEVATYKDENGYTVVPLDKAYKAVSYELELTAYGPPTESPRFIDMEEYDWARAAVEQAVEKEILPPEADKFFCPQKDITRGQFTAALIRSLGLQGETSDQFSDVTEYNSENKEIAAAKSLGIALGDETGAFRPHDQITRQDATVLVCRALAIPQPEYMKNAVYKDFDQVAEYARYAVSLLSEMKIMQGKTTNLLCPTENMTRAETAVFMERLRKEVENGKFAN